MNEDEARELHPGDEIAMDGIHITAIVKRVVTIETESQGFPEERVVVVFELAGTEGCCTPGFISSVVKRAAQKPKWYDRIWFTPEGGWQS